MARSIIATLAILGLGSIGFVVIAQEQDGRAAFLPDKSPTLATAPVETITFTAVTADNRSVIRVTAGDVVFTVPSFTFPISKSAIQTVTVEGGTMVMRSESTTVECKSLTMKLRGSKPAPEPDAISAPSERSRKVPSPDNLNVPPFDVPPAS